MLTDCFLTKCCFLLVVFWTTGSIFLLHARAVSVSKCTGRETEIHLDTTHGRLRGSCKFITVNNPDPKRIQNPDPDTTYINRDGNVYSWRGVPYAEPPINALRFRRPIDVRPWNDVLNATRLPNACLSEATYKFERNEGKSSNPFSGFNMWETSSRQKLTFSEDCLYLNIYLPDQVYLRANLVAAMDDPPKPPIIVFFHGGDTVYGSSSLDVYDPSIFVAASNTIVITVNYRLGIFGFLSYGEEIQGNMALQDQNLALKWISNNADLIGGDPSRITLVGHGAGAVLTGYHLFYKESWDRFRNMILQSGTPLLTALKPITKAEADKRTVELFKHAGCEIGSSSSLLSSKDVAECIRSFPNAAELAANHFGHLLASKEKSLLYLKTYFPPVVDGEVIRGDPETLLEKGKFKKCPLILGFTADEGSMEIGRSGLFGADATELKVEESLNHTALAAFVHEYFSFYPNYPKDSDHRLLTNSILYEYTKIMDTSEDDLASSQLLKSNYFTTLKKIISDQAYICPAYKLAEYFSRDENDLSVHLYLYAHRLSSTPWPSWFGAVHGDDLAVSFGLPLAKRQRRTPYSTNPWTNSRYKYPNSERVLSLEVINYLANFARVDTPNLRHTSPREWLEFKQHPESKQSSTLGNYLILKTHGTKMGRGYSIDKCQFWNSHLPNLVKQQLDIKERLTESRLLSQEQKPATCSATSTIISKSHIVFFTFYAVALLNHFTLPF